MRIVLKQGGVIVLLGALTLLTAVAVISQRGRGANATGAFSASAGTLRAPPRHGLSLLTADDIHRWAFVNPATVVESSWTTDPALPAGERDVLHIDLIKPDTTQFWSAQIGQSIKTAIPQGHKLAVRFWARSKTSNTIQVAFMQNATPFDKAVNSELKLTPQWQEYKFPFTTTRAYSADGAALQLQLAFAPAK